MLNEEYSDFPEEFTALTLTCWYEFPPSLTFAERTSGPCDQVLPSSSSNSYPVIVSPPVFGAVHEIEFVSAPLFVSVGVAGVSGLVVT